MMTQKYMHVATGAIYTFDEIVANIPSEELEDAQASTPSELAHRYIKRDIFIKMDALTQNKVK